MALISIKLLRQSGRSKLYLIPHLFTLFNALFGFLSVIYALEDNIAASAYCLIAAAFMDGLDGRLARALNVTSTLGMELDSLCDAVSFCFAPTILLYSWSLHDGGLPGMAVLIIYLWAGLFRLAKFNVFASEQRKYFSGLPTTVASFFIAQYVLQFEWLKSSLLSPMTWPSSILLTVLIIAALKISSIPFAACKSFTFTWKRALNLGALGLMLWALCGSPFLFLLTFSYIIIGVAAYVVNFAANNFQVLKD